jgi:hypothetical protein
VLLVDDQPLEIYKEDAKTLLEFAARDQSAAGADELLSALKRLLRGHEERASLSANALVRLRDAAHAVVAENRASAPLIALHSRL